MTVRVQLVATGDLERLALHQSLARCFAGQDAVFLPPQKVTGFTSSRLAPYPGRAGRGTLPRAARLAAALEALCWRRATRFANHTAFPRALVADEVAEALEAGPPPGSLHPLTALKSGGLLRNL